MMKADRVTGNTITSTTYTGTWFFLLSSILFGMRPTIKLVREIAYLRIDDLEDAADPHPIPEFAMAQSSSSTMHERH